MDKTKEGSMVMVFPEEHIMNRATTATNTNYPEPIGAQADHGAPGQQIRIKFYPGLGYAPCINQEKQSRENYPIIY